MFDLVFKKPTHMVQRWYSEDFYEIFYYLDLPEEMILEITFDDWTLSLVGTAKRKP